MLITTIVMAAVMYDTTGQTIEFSTSEGCESFTETFQGDCGVCLSPPGNFGSVLFSGISSTQEVQIFNEAGCTSASLVGQGFGPACWDQGHTSIRSALVSC
ncbi:hypothetical protein BT96DRAFT_830704 [Gymnopus androsaceus JB14]|uniref:Uncharacterized protein n=1 Tax=Gymnopus androsaceus JB14 TaxID=1447944 RepID=A0A6A4H3R8_9AGAR|nr:hypothetical protein BT96DRAFT_830685 [Gymnopus androsaceus JB14]KAE9392394.1 hypothetical protein BT96DRAFT_830704 [Gymnopus androsaceus JB14]